MNRKRFNISAFVFVAIFTACWSHAENISPGWTMYGGDKAHTGRFNGSGGFLDGRVKWEITAGNSLYSSPAVGPDGNIYVPAGTLKAYSPQGVFLWEYPVGNYVNSTPAVSADGTVYVGSHDMNLYAVSCDGELEWTFKTRDWIEASPAIGEDGTIFVGSRDSTFYALNPDGTLKWNYSTAGEIFSSAAISNDGSIYFGSSDNYLYALDPDGKLKWRLPGMASTYSSPSVGSDGTVYIMPSTGGFTAISPDGTRKWPEDIMITSSYMPAIGLDGKVYISGYSNLTAVNPDGTIDWQWEPPFWTARSNLVIGGDNVIYVTGYMDDEVMYLVAITQDGLLKWKYPVMHGASYYDCWSTKCSMLIFPSPAFGPDGTLYVPTELGELFAFSHDDPVFVEKDTLTPDNIIANYPNPFNPLTTISFSLSEAGTIRLTIYSITGEKVRTLVEGWCDAGEFSAVFDGSGLSSGMYFYRLETGMVTETGRMMLVK